MTQREERLIELQREKMTCMCGDCREFVEYTFAPDDELYLWLKSPDGSGEATGL